MARTSTARMPSRRYVSAILALSAAFNASATPPPSVTTVWSQTVVKPSTVATAGWRKSLGLYAQVRETCFSKGEKTDGMNKICFYSCPSGEAAITVSAASICPISIEK